MSRPERIAIVGGGVIGLGIGWQLARAGCAVSIYEREEAGRSASWAAAGMLSPLSEAHLVESEQVKLGLLSARIYPEWVEELEGYTGMPVGYRTGGALRVALDQDDARELEHLYETQRRLGLQVEWLRGAEARRIEPLLSPRVTAAISCAGDGQVDNGRMVEALIAAFRKAGGELREHAPVDRVEVENERARGVRVQGEFAAADLVIVAAGCWSAGLEGLPEEVRPPVRPVKGQILSVQMEGGFALQQVIWAPDAYLVPREDGRLIIGATSEEKGFDTRITAGGILELLRGAWEAVPGIYELPLTQTLVGLRPGSRDNAPILGKTRVENLIMATGHFRKGILLTPVTAREISALVLSGETSEIIAPFQLLRFAEKDREYTGER